MHPISFLLPLFWNNSPSYVAWALSSLLCTFSFSPLISASVTPTYNIFQPSLSIHVVSNLFSSQVIDIPGPLLFFQPWSSSPLPRLLPPLMCILSHSEGCRAVTQILFLLNWVFFFLCDFCYWKSKGIMFLVSQTSNRTKPDDMSNFKCLLSLNTNKSFKPKVTEILAALNVTWDFSGLNPPGQNFLIW